MLRTRAHAGSPTGRLLASLRPDGPAPANASRLAELVAAVEDQRALARSAARERLAPLLYASLARAGLVGLLEPGVARQLRLSYRRTALANLRRTADAEELLAGAAARDVRPVLLKGIVLLEVLYADPGRRPMSDVDLWVSSAECDRLTGWLREAGYRRDPLYPGTHRRGSTTLDLHTSLLGDRVASRRDLLAAGEEVFRRRLRSIDYNGQRAWRLGRHDEIVYLTLHALKHGVARLLWLVDLEGLVAGWGAADREALVDRAREMGQEPALRQVSFLVESLLEPSSRSAFAQLATHGSPGWLERRVLRRRLHGEPLPSWAPLLLFTSHGGPAARVRYLFETLFPRPEILRQTLHDSQDLRPWQLYWRRFFQLIERVVR